MIGIYIHTQGVTHSSCSGTVIDSIFSSVSCKTHDCAELAFSPCNLADDPCDSYSASDNAIACCSKSSTIVKETES